MQLTLWTYEGPPHIGAMRIATALKDVHYVLHAPQGDTYADLLFTMIQRSDKRPPVTYTTFQARDLGGDTAELFKTATRNAYERFQPAAMLVGASCTAELIQDDPGGLAKALALPIPVVPLELPAYQRKENWGAAETLYQLVRSLCPAPAGGKPVRAPRPEGQRPRCNLLGPTALGFRHRDDVIEITRLLGEMGIDVTVVAPLGAGAADLARLHEADFNVVLYPEVAGTTASWLARVHGQPHTRTVPIGVGATLDFIREVAVLAGVDASALLDSSKSRAPWYSRSVDSTYLTGKRVFIFGDASHVVAAARIADQELGFQVVGLGSYSREFAREIREAAKVYGVEPLITDDYLTVEAHIAELQPELVLGTQMERHIAKRLGLPCAVISAPVHVQDFPARYAPQMGFEGANVLFDTWVHPLMMGLEEHLLTMFKGDAEFHEDAAPSHLGRTSAPQPAAVMQPARVTTVAELLQETTAVTAASAAVSPAPTSPAPIAAAQTSAAPQSPATLSSASVTQLPVAATATASANSSTWADEAERELKKIPFFVRGKARRNTERYALEKGLTTITLETLYDAKAHFSR
jgi:light-independent protochlorophyllide reductase subunit B